VIEITQLTKVYADTRAVDELDFRVRPGIVTGFLGPNGAGKSTTMRMILGLDRPTSGTATVDGRTWRDRRAPLHEIGALLDAGAIHPGRSARDHLRSLAVTNGIGDRRVDEVLEVVGLAEVAARPAGNFSLGMGQRLGIASALLGDPHTIMLDEPVNGLDPEGIIWIRTLLKSLASEGRTVFVSSHLMSEMSMTADHFVVIGRGRLIADVSADELVRMGGGESVRVVTPDADDLRDALHGVDIEVTVTGPDQLDVVGLTSKQIGRRAAEKGIVLYELTPRAASLEQTFISLTHDAVEYHGGATPEPTAGPALSGTVA
jgi:ABC-2 type transport system ATP-binding protein